MKISEELLENIRSTIRDYLKLLADLETQREYERNVLIADVPAELVCGWFDDFYQPESPAFQAAFNTEQLSVLAEFSDLFTAELGNLPDPLPRLSELQTHPAWFRVASGAARALHGLTN